MNRKIRRETRNILLNNRKKALSEMVAYVILIVIAVSLSALVYGWLKSSVFKTPELKCKQGTSLNLDDYACAAKKINITLRNTGNFNIDGFLIKISNELGKQPVYNLELNNIKEIQFLPYLKPGDSENFTLSYLAYNQIYAIEIIPFSVDKTLILCNESIIHNDVHDCI